MSDWKPTTCMRCAVGCGHLQQGDDDGLTAARGDPDHPTNRGGDCERGVRETVSPAGERLTTPLVRRGGRLRPTTWDTALGVVATRLIESLSGDGDVAVLGSGQQTNEAVYALGKLARGGLGTPYYDANTTLCMASAVRAYVDAFGADAPPPTYDDIPGARTHVVWGANPAVAHPVLYRRIADSAAEDGCQLLVVDPVETRTAAEADVHLKPEPGTDLALARATLARVVAADDVDTAFIGRFTEGFEETMKSLPDVEAAAATAGVPTDQIDALARALSAPTLLYWGMGVNQSTRGTATARGLIDLCLATGNLGPGSGPFSLTGQANSMGSRVCGATGTWPGRRDFEAPDGRKAVARAWDVPVRRLPDAVGPGYTRILDAVARDEVDVCWTVATNPVVGVPDATYVRSALDETFLVVQDAFRSDAVEYADVVLPAATWGEVEGTTINMERRVSRLTAATDPPGKARPDLDIVAAVGDRIDPDLFDAPPLDPETVFDELRALTTGTAADLSGISYDRLAAEGAVRWPAPDPEAAGGYRYRDPDGGWTFHTDSGRARFSTAGHSALPEPIDEAFPLVLTTGRRTDAYNTGVRSRDGDDGPPVARINSETVGAYVDAIDRGRTVVESRRADAVVDVRPDDGVPPGIVWLEIHDPAVNALTLPAVDPESEEPNYKQCAVRLRVPDPSQPSSRRSSGRA